MPDGADQNRKHGVEFHYGGESSGGSVRRRSRSRRRPRSREPNWQEKREERKGLWSRMVPANGATDSAGPSTKATDTDSDASDAGRNVAARPASSSKSPGSTANGWERAALPTAEKEKFLKLMGGAKNGVKPTADVGAISKEPVAARSAQPDHKKRDREMEQQYWDSMRLGRGRGLGAR
mmetsp:Transcript_32104/g.84767  ORF Transcript_32104/g.84767 Transcript_32104/m.84767 type:complete len:179 (-) Transcript_32104:33-569(-)